LDVRRRDLQKAESEMGRVVVSTPFAKFRLRLASAILGRELLEEILDHEHCAAKLTAANKKAHEYESRLNYILVTEGMISADDLDPHDWDNAQTQVMTDGLPVKFDKPIRRPYGK
jgi:hypothetical protein